MAILKNIIEEREDKNLQLSSSSSMYKLNNEIPETSGTAHMYIFLRALQKQEFFGDVSCHIGRERCSEFEHYAQYLIKMTPVPKDARATRLKLRFFHLHNARHKKTLICGTCCVKYT